MSRWGRVNVEHKDRLDNWEDKFCMYMSRLCLSFVVGLFVGNVIKDIFELPRPNGVWRPKQSFMVDDFGFPSTHSMNSPCTLYFSRSLSGFFFAPRPEGIFAVRKHFVNRQNI